MKYHSIQIKSHKIINVTADRSFYDLIQFNFCRFWKDEDGTTFVLKMKIEVTDK